MYPIRAGRIQLDRVTGDSRQFGPPRGRSHSCCRGKTVSLFEFHLEVHDRSVIALYPGKDLQQQCTAICDRRRFGRYGISDTVSTEKCGSQFFQVEHPETTLRLKLLSGGEKHLELYPFRSAEASLLLKQFDKLPDRSNEFRVCRLDQYSRNVLAHHSHAMIKFVRDLRAPGPITLVRNAISSP